jgi:hypothetical protein
MTVSNRQYPKENDTETESNAEKTTMTESNTDDTSTKAMTDGGRGQIEAELYIDYIGAFEDEINNATVDATITHEGDRVHVKTEDSGFAFEADESRDSVRLYSHYTTADGHEREELAFVKNEADDNRISLSWTHNDQHVDSVVLDDTSYGWVIDILDEARAKQDHLTVAEATAETGVDVPEIQVVVTETTVSRTGWGRGRSLSQTETVVELADDAAVDTETWELWSGAVQRAGDYQLTHYTNYMYPPEGQGYEPGDTLSLHEYIDEWHCIDAAEVLNEAEIAQVSPADFEVGNIVEIEREDRDPKRGVIMSVSDADDVEPSAEVYWDSHSYSLLTLIDGVPRIGRMGNYGHIKQIELVDDLSAVGDDLTDLRERAIDSAAVDEQAGELSVDVEKTWEASGAVEGDRATDLHPRVTVSGPLLDEPATVHCRNVFDFGWTATIEGNLNEDTAAVVKRAARNNSPIPTGVRL